MCLVSDKECGSIWVYTKQRQMKEQQQQNSSWYRYLYFRRSWMQRRISDMGRIKNLINVEVIHLTKKLNESCQCFCILKCVDPLFFSFVPVFWTYPVKCLFSLIFAIYPYNRQVVQWFRNKFSILNWNKNWCLGPEKLSAGAG